MKKMFSALFPLDEAVSGRIKLLYAIAPMIAVAANGLVSCCASSFASVIADELGLLPYLAVIMMMDNLFNSLSAPIGGKLGDLFGRRTMMLIGIVPLIISILFCALAKSFFVFIVGWGLMGLALGITLPNADAMYPDMFCKKDCIRIANISNSVYSGSILLGNIGGGWLIDQIGVRSTMLLFTLVFFIAWLCLFFFSPDIRNISADVQIDWKGIISLLLMIGPFTVAFCLGGKQLAWSSPWLYGAFMLSIIGAVVFFRVEKTARQPLIDFKLFKIPYYLPAAFIILCKAAQSPLNQYSSVYGQMVLGYSATKIGTASILILIPTVIGPLVGQWLADTQKFRTAFAIASGLLMVFVLLNLFCMQPDMPFWLYMVIRGVGNLCTCFTLGPIISLLSVMLPAQLRGVGISLVSTILFIINTVLTSVAGMIYNIYESDILIAYRPMCVPSILITGVVIIIVIFGFKDLQIKTTE